MVQPAKDRAGADRADLGAHRRRWHLPEDGLYRFDPDSGQLVQQLGVVDASAAIGPRPSGAARETRQSCAT